MSETSVYRRSYRNYEGKMVRRFRWAIVMEQELRVLSQSRPFKAFCLLGALHVILRLLQIVAYDVIMQNPNHPMSSLFIHMSAIVVKEDTFFDFVRIQAPLVLITLLYCGAGMLCNDFRHNLMAVYFSKPLRWFDYMLGKALALSVVGLGLTALPGIVLVVMHNLLAPSMELLRASYWWPLSVLGFSLVVVVPGVLGVLASSALMNSENFAAIAVIMLLAADTALAAILSDSLHWQNLLLLSFPLSLNRIGESLFLQTNVMFNAPLTWPLLFWAALCVLCGVVVALRVRRAEVAA